MPTDSPTDARLALVVKNPFGSYARGALIEDSTTIEDIGAGSFAGCVLRIMLPLPAPVASAGTPSFTVTKEG